MSQVCARQGHTKSDLATVFVSEGCIGATTQTVFVLCLLVVLLACTLLHAIVTPWIFGSKWQAYDHLKRRKMVGFFVKIFVRLSCAVQLLVLVAPWFDLAEGLFAHFNVQAANRLLHFAASTTCAAAGMSQEDATALRVWVFVRDSITAVMAWELAFIPELPLNAWLHHLFVILGVALGSDPQMTAPYPHLLPLIESVTFLLVLGATMAAAVEVCVLMYHFVAPDGRRQAFWMAASIVVQAIVVLVLFVWLPACVIAEHYGNLDMLGCFIVFLLAFLAVVESRMMVIKWFIVKNARRKGELQALEAVEVGPPHRCTVDPAADRTAGAPVAAQMPFSSPSGGDERQSVDEIK